MLSHKIRQFPVFGIVARSGGNRGYDAGSCAIDGQVNFVASIRALFRCLTKAASGSIVLDPLLVGLGLLPAAGAMFGVCLRAFRRCRVIFFRVVFP